MKIPALFCLCAGMMLATPSAGTTLAFSGRFTNANAPAAAGGRCAALTVTIANGPAPLFATGLSNFGAFTASQSHCLDGPPPLAPGAADRPYYDGLFTFSFADGKTLFGTYDGVLSNAGVFGAVDNVQRFVITGGTGLFTGASGGFDGTGALRFGAGLPTATLDFSNGVIEVTAVPEPESWALLVTGFGVAGSLLRRRRARPDRPGAVRA